MQPVHTTLFLDSDPIGQGAFRLYRQEILEGNGSDIPELFKLLVNRNLSIPKVLMQDPPLYNQIKNLTGLFWVSHAVEISVESQMQKKNWSEVWLGRKVSLLKEDLEDGDLSVADHVEQFLTQTGVQGLDKLLSDQELFQVFSSNSSYWSERLIRCLPDCKTKVLSIFNDHRSQAKTPVQKKSVKVSEKERLMAQLRIEIQVSRSNLSTSIVRFLEKNGQGRLWDIFQDQELSEILLQDTEYPWVEPVLDAFGENHTLIEKFLSREWSNREDFFEYLQSHHQWVDALSEHFDPMTPFLFLFYFVKKDYDTLSPSIESEAFHKLFLNPKYLEIFHHDEEYSWIPYYLRRFRKNGVYINSFLADRLLKDRKLKELVDQNPAWVTSLVNSNPRVTSFIFTVLLLQNKLHLQVFSPDELEFYFSKIPNWVEEMYLDPSSNSLSGDSFSLFLDIWGQYFDDEGFKLENIQEFLQFLPSLRPMELVLLAKDLRFHYMMAKALAHFPPKALMCMIPTLNVTGFWTLMREMPLEMHPLFLAYATTAQKEFYSSMQPFQADYELENLESDLEKTGFFVRQRVEALERI
ncbi:MAG: hypothetical protein FJZ60_04715, partial [Chlamydiae bacterium]|nr:hypothetical protein [Chlamydiota bacterium]